MLAFRPPAQRFGKTTASCLATLMVLIGVGVMAGTATSAGVTDVIGPIPSEDFSSPTKNYTFYATDVALASYGYVEEEFFITGTANAYSIPSNPTTPPTIATADVPYKTRMTVRRPTDPAKFNGTVVVEWFNVTDGFDGEYFWVQAHHYLVRAGYAYIGISAQNNGISNAKTGLKAFSPTRYGSLDVTGNGTITGDALSYDIFSQAAKAAYDFPAVMKGLTVKNTIGVGMSQSGSRLGTYANYIQKLARIYDALLIQVATPTVRDDLTTPLIKVLSETEASARNLNADQADTDYRKTYWIAGTNHGDETQRIGRTSVRLRDLGPQNTPNDSCSADPSVTTRTRTPFRHVLNAAVHYLKEQIEHGAQPPKGPRFTRAANGDVLRDSFGNAVGAIRLAHMDVPTARADGIQCGTIGAWVPFTTAQLQALYPTHDDYVTKVKAAVNASVAAGFVLPEDAVETIAEAEASVIGTGLECGPLCLSVSHWRPAGTTPSPFSSTGLLRDNTVYLNIKDGNDLIEDLDAAHSFAAAGYSTPGVHATHYFALAAARLQKYLDQVEDAQSEGRLTATAAGVLSQQAEIVIEGLHGQFVRGNEDRPDKP